MFFVWSCLVIGCLWCVGSLWPSLTGHNTHGALMDRDVNQFHWFIEAFSCSWSFLLCYWLFYHQLLLLSESAGCCLLVIVAVTLNHLLWIPELFAMTFNLKQIYNLWSWVLWLLCFVRPGSHQGIFLSCHHQSQNVLELVSISQSSSKCAIS